MSLLRLGISLTIFSWLVAGSASFAQKSHRIKGLVLDANGEALSFANIQLNENAYGIATDEKGRFELNLPKGNYTLSTSYVGFNNVYIQLKLLRDTSISIEMQSVDRELREVVVLDKRNDRPDPLISAQSSAIKMTQRDIEMVPTIAGENDIIKVVQLLPGVNKGIEGTGDFFVRGGDADQNLLLLDGATIYNTGHLFGFVSVFNSDIIGESTILKGAFPAYYGGRLSSILDIRTQSTITENTEGEGAIGLLSSKFTLKTPIKKNKIGLMLSGRRTYIDQVIRVASSASNNNLSLPYYFYDLNGRVDYNLNEKHRFYLSAYYGADILKFEEEAEDRGDGSTFQSNNTIWNHSQTLGYQYQPSTNYKLNLEVFQSTFSYEIFNSFLNEKIYANSGIEDIGANLSIQQKLSEKSTLYYGASILNHSVSPITFETDGVIASILPSSRSKPKMLNEGSIYAELSHDLTDLIRVRAGYRQSFGMVDGIIYPGFEPRLAIRYKLDEMSSLKLSYSRMYQYLHRVSSSSLTLPIDLWYSVTSNIKPQSANQYSIGYVWQNKKQGITLESDVYFKEMDNLTEYEPGTTLLFNAEFEDALLQGSGESYGIEFLLRKEGDKFYGWLSYSLGWSYRQFNGLNEGNPFNSTYDRRHNGAIVLQYNFWKRLAVSGVWEFISGSRFTPVIGQYAVINPPNTGIDVLNIYSKRNEVTLSDAHRLDLMLILKSREKRRFQGEWRAGVYNVYNRATPVQMYVSIDDSGNYQYIQPGLFGTLPFISYHFKF